ncbi:blastula protease 10 [Aplysia californica]|uniref:Metalloendopeptidase n=1 Tax=Aplysia californica TaxID=6500 RepID=A0ABM1VUH3_APLCA|nr:blastula protease 10 [Aplysia californica]
MSYITEVKFLWTTSVLLLLVSTSTEMSLDKMIEGAAKNERAIEFLGTDHKDSVIVELDMKYSPEQYAELVALNASSVATRRRRKRNALRDKKYRWTDNVIPFELSSSLKPNAPPVIMEAMQEWSMYTCITFRPAQPTDTNKIRFVDGSGCAAYVGMVPNRHEVVLAEGCLYKGIVLHELGHVLGFHHEQTRPDRDDYVSILYQNIEDEMEYNFHKYNWGVIDSFGVPYDYRSIMHYGSTAFSQNGETTIKTLDPLYQSVIGNRMSLSFRDIKIANKMLNCKPSSCALDDAQCPGEGFPNEFCQCVCPGPTASNPIILCEAEAGSGASTGSTSGTVAKACKDLSPDCPILVRQNACTLAPALMQVHCQASCGFCKGAAVKPCIDEHIHCSTWASLGYCVNPQYLAFMLDKCKRSCALCH